MFLRNRSNINFDTPLPKLLKRISFVHERRELCPVEVDAVLLGGRQQRLARRKGLCVGCVVLGIR